MTLKQAYLDGEGGFLTALEEVFGVLRAAHWFHWTAHWQSKSQYGDHLLFERLYTGVTDEIDTLAEKLVGYFGEGGVDPNVSLSHTSLWIQKWTLGGSMATISGALQAEQDIQDVLKATYDALKADGKLTLGLDDFIMAVANAHETNIYLLQQRMNVQ